jgi:hypothetical protein
MMEPDLDDLTPGYAHARGKGVVAYLGVLRDLGREVWRCTHKPHLVATVAVRCAEAELERRRQGSRLVLVLLHCPSCDIYFGPQARGGEDSTGHCSLCVVPLTPVKVMILDPGGS